MISVMQGIWISLLALILALHTAQASVFRYSEQRVPESLDPHRISSYTAANLLTNLFEGLTTLDPRTFTVQPGVAERWEISQDGKTYRFYLRHDARWSNGEPVRAEDFVYAWQRALAKGTNNPYAYQFYPIVGAKNFHQRENGSPHGLGFSARSPTLLEVKLAFPVPYFLKLTMLPTFLPLHQGSLKAGDHWWKPETMVSNGPFRLQTFDTVEKQLVMMRNQHYWQREQMELSQVEVFFSLSVQEVLRRYRAKLLDYTGDVFLPSDAVSKAAQRSDLHFEPWLATMFLRLNCRRPPFNDRRVRQAVRLAIDRQTLVNRAFPPGLVPARSLLPPQLDLDDGAALPFDPQQARALLAAAGYCVDKKSNSCRKLPTVALLHNQEGLEYRQTVQLIVDMLKENLGWPNIELRMVGWDDYLRATQTGDYDLARSSWIADYADPSTFLKLMLGYEGNNRTGWSHEEYNQLIYKSEVERGQSERTTLMNRAQRILAEEAPIVPIHHLVHHYLLQPEVKGFHANPLHQLVLKALQVLPDGQVKP